MAQIIAGGTKPDSGGNVEVITQTQTTTLAQLQGKPYIAVSSKGIYNGLSTIPNDGADFGPDTTLGATAPGQYGAPYTLTAAIQEGMNYGIPTVILSPGVFILNAQVTLPSNVTLRGSGGLWNPGTAGFPIPASDIPSPVTVIAYPSSPISSNFPQASMFYGNNATNGLLFENFTMNLNNVTGYSGINLNVTTSAPAQYNSAWFKDLSVININTTGIGISLSGAWEDNNVLMNLQFDGQGTAINANNIPVLIWLYNVQDFTTGGMAFNNVYVYIVGGIQQRIAVSNCQVMSIVNGSFTNANASVGILVGSAVDVVVLENTGILIPLSSFINTGNGANTISSFTMKNCSIDTSLNTTFIDSVPAIKKWIDEDNVLVSSALPTNFPFSFVSTPVSGHLLSSKANNATLTANPPVSGTIYQNTNPYDREIDLPVYATTSGTAGSVVLQKGPTDTPPSIGQQFINGSTSTTATDIIRLRVPAQWYYEFVSSGVTFGTASVFQD